MNTKSTIAFYYTFGIGCTRALMEKHIDVILKAIKKQDGAYIALRGIPLIWAIFVAFLAIPFITSYGAISKDIVFLRLFSIGSIIFLLCELIEAINAFRWENPKPIEELRKLIYLLGREWTVEDLLRMKAEEVKKFTDDKLDELAYQIMSLDPSHETTIAPIRRELGKLYRLCRIFNLITFDGWDPIFERVRIRMETARIAKGQVRHGLVSKPA